MNQVTIPFNADQHNYYAVFNKTKEGDYVQCSTEHEALRDPVEQWRDLIRKNPDQTFGIYQVLISQLYVPLDP